MHLGPPAHSDDVISATFSLATSKWIVLKEAQTSCLKHLAPPFLLNVWDYAIRSFMFMERKEQIACCAPEKAL